MSNNLLVISSQFFSKNAQEAFKRLAVGCDLRFAAYRDFDELAEIYRANAGWLDICFVSGTTAKAAIELELEKVNKPIVAYQVGADSLHMALLRLAVQKQSLDFSRIIIDFLIPIGNSCFVSDYLNLNSMEEIAPLSNEKMMEFAADNISEFENYIAHRIIELWDSGKIDLVLCLYSSIAPVLQEHGIEFLCPFISDKDLKSLIDEALLRLELNRLYDGHAAVIQVFPCGSANRNIENTARIAEVVEDYFKRNILEHKIEVSDSCCTVHTSMREVRVITDGLEKCSLSALFEQGFEFSVSVGYGVGPGVAQAMNNAQTASKEARLTGKSFISDSAGNLVGPLDSEKRMVISNHAMQDVSQIAKHCRLSSMTIQRLMSIIRTKNSNMLSTQELAKHLDTTARNANRIIGNLTKAGFAKPVYTQSSHSRGRPVQVYMLEFDTVAHN